MRYTSLVKFLLMSVFRDPICSKQIYEDIDNLTRKEFIEKYIGDMNLNNDQLLDLLNRSNTFPEENNLSEKYGSFRNTLETL